MKTVAKYLLESLASYGVDTVFGIPGVHTIELYRSLPNSGIRHVTPRHEQGAGFMADGYARASGRVGVCFVITGPGLTNTLTAMAQAYADSVPMLVISGVNARGNMNSGMGWLHELPNQQALAREVSAFSQTVLTPDDLPAALSRAFAIFKSARPRPVHIEIPLDIMPADASHLPQLSADALPGQPVADKATMMRAAEWLDQAKAPLILAGGGAVEAGPELRALAESLTAPVVMTVNARGVLPPDHPLGVSASISMQPVRDLLAKADVVLAVGTECGPTDYDMYGIGYPVVNGNLIRLDIDPEQAMRGLRPDLVLIGGAKPSLAALGDLVAGGNKPALSAGAVGKDAQAALPDILRVGARFVDAIRDALPDVTIVGDSTQPVYGAQLDFIANAPRKFFCSASGYGTLGYALPAASGASLAVKGPVVALIGDGGIQFTLPELAVARELDLPVIIVLWNNTGYREIKTSMIDAGVPPEGVDIFTPDFQKIAEGYGCAKHQLTSMADLPALLQEAAQRQGPTLIEVNEAIVLRDLG